MLASYLSDASAHSAHRLIRNARTGFIEPAVRPDDAQLTFLFARHHSGVLTLTPERCALLLDQFPDIKHLRCLLDGSLGPYAREDEVFSEIAARQLATRRQASEEVQFPNKDGVRTDVISFADGGRFGKHVRVNSYIEGYSPHVSTEAGDYLGPDPAAYRHDDPNIEAMQRGVA